VQSKIIALVDCNNFYASCERVFAPHLRAQPIVVLSNNDGCVISRSQEAKALGIKMGVPLFKIRHDIERHHIQVLSSNYTLYGDMSDRVMQVLAEFTQTLEVYSIDEAFLEIPVAQADYAKYCQQLRLTVLRSTGIPVSIGIGTTKTLAKLANHMAKNHPAYEGVFDLTCGDQAVILAETAIEQVWGVGRNYARTLRVHGIETALQLRDSYDGWIKQRFGVVLLRTVLELRGVVCLPLDLKPPTRKSLMVSRSFGKPVVELPELNAAISTYTAKAAEKLRRFQLVAGVIMVFVRTSAFEDAYYSNSIKISLPIPTNFTPELLHHALLGVATLYRQGDHYKKAGVILLQLGPESMIQGNLFVDNRDWLRSRQLMQALDAMNANQRDSLQFAVAGGKQEWQPKAAWRSPRYTTRWDEIPLVKAG
jgi:DNA polymerase V